jgi:small neutral amino acid transporter SnatA (MarC family)
VAGPGAVLVAIALATRDGTGTTLVAVGVAFVATLVALRFIGSGRWVNVAERCIGAGMVVIAFDLIRDGVIAV